MIDIRLDHESLTTQPPRSSPDKRKGPRFPIPPPPSRPPTSIDSPQYLVAPTLDESAFEETTTEIGSLFVEIMLEKVLSDSEYQKKVQAIMARSIPLLEAALYEGPYHNKAAQTIEYLYMTCNTLKIDLLPLQALVIRNLPIISENINSTEIPHLRMLNFLAGLIGPDMKIRSGNERLIEILVSKNNIYDQCIPIEPDHICPAVCLPQVMLYGTREQATVARQKLINYLIGKFHKEGRYLAGTVASYFATSQPRAIREVGEEVLKIIFQFYGLDPSEMLTWWDDAGSDYYVEENGVKKKRRSKEQTFEWNLEALLVLEKERPGIAKILKEEFGIHNFGRYPLEVLIKQVDEIGKQGPYGIGIYAKSDWNGGFFDTKEWMKPLAEELSSLPRPRKLRIFEADNRPVLARYYALLDRNYGTAAKIEFAIYSGHGTAGTITLDSTKGDEGRISVKDLVERRVTRLRQYYIADGRKPFIILNACSTGELGGIGDYIAKKTYSLVIVAPKKPAGIQELHAHEDDNGQLTLDVEYPDEEAKTIYLGRDAG